MTDNKTDAANLQVRLAGEADINLVFSFINELADYEKMSDEVVATKEILFDSLFVKHHAEALIGEYMGKPVGFALFFTNFSSFLGNASLYLEDIYIQPTFRGIGMGKKIFAFLANLCVERGYERMDWCCLDWNETSIEFYKKMGAHPMSEWTTYRLDGQKLADLSKTQ